MDWINQNWHSQYKHSSNQSTNNMHICKKKNYARYVLMSSFFLSIQIITFQLAPSWYVWGKNFKITVVISIIAMQCWFNVKCETTWQRNVQQFIMSFKIKLHCIVYKKCFFLNKYKMKGTSMQKHYTKYYYLFYLLAFIRFTAVFWLSHYCLLFLFFLLSKNETYRFVSSFSSSTAVCSYREHSWNMSTSKSVILLSALFWSGKKQLQCFFH